ncbi:MAG TPA: arginine deiminase family protein [Puia sp.]|nr:arginine deiminase family protein [Puia sp.]
MSTTSHSETGKISSLLIKNARAAFLNEDNVHQQWAALHYLSKPDVTAAIAEYANFESIVKKYADEIYYLPEDDAVTMDSIYCRDAAIATNKGMIICNMGKPARRNEPFAEQKAFEKNNIPVLGAIKYPGTVEGGDVAWLDENMLAVGHTYRTNEEGIRQLRSLLDPVGVEVVVAELPHYKGPADVFHLMSILSPVDKNLAVVYSPLMPIAFRNLLLKRNYELIEVPDDEFEQMGCNVLALAPRVCLMVAGNLKTKQLLEKSGCEVIEYSGNEISVKGGGGPTCLTRPIVRHTS